jgi:hypothetical protein
MSGISNESNINIEYGDVYSELLEFVNSNGIVLDGPVCPNCDVVMIPFNFRGYYDEMTGVWACNCNVGSGLLFAGAYV